MVMKLCALRKCFAESSTLSKVLQLIVLLKVCEISHRKQHLGLHLILNVFPHVNQHFILHKANYLVFNKLWPIASKSNTFIYFIQFKDILSCKLKCCFPQSLYIYIELSSSMVYSIQPPVMSTFQPPGMSKKEKAT